MTGTSYLRLTVYRAADRQDCTMGGISSRYDTLALVGTVDQRYPADLSSRAVKPLPAGFHAPELVEHPEGSRFAAAPVALVVRNMGTKVYASLLPAEQAEDGTWQTIETSGPAGAVMAGGNYATGDSRVGELMASFLGKPKGSDWHAGPQTVIPVHDRVEPWR